VGSLLNPERVMEPTQLVRYIIAQRWRAVTCA